MERPAVTEGVSSAGSKPARVSKKRRVLVYALVVFASLLILVAVFATWAKTVILDTPVGVDTSSRFLTDDTIRPATITVLVVGAVGLLAAWVAGPTRPAVAIRRFASPAMRRPEPVYGVYAFVLLLLLLWGPTRSTRNVITVPVLFGLATIGLEVLRRQIVREYPDAEGPDVWGRLAALGGGAVARVRGGHHANEPPRPPPDPGAAP